MAPFISPQRRFRSFRLASDLSEASSRRRSHARLQRRRLRTKSFTASSVTFVAEFSLPISCIAELKKFRITDCCASPSACEISKESTISCMRSPWLAANVACLFKAAPRAAVMSTDGGTQSMASVKMLESKTKISAVAKTSLHMTSRAGPVSDKLLTTALQASEDCSSSFSMLSAESGFGSTSSTKLMASRRGSSKPEILAFMDSSLMSVDDSSLSRVIS
mmetsp:Transcript_3099/g.5454  ORF Transcript_3099/g.5454 Transcript_3099/m.5454 type:complete len:220 (+) Transcript_3099:161-820(+)